MWEWAKDDVEKSWQFFIVSPSSRLNSAVKKGVRAVKEAVEDEGEEWTSRVEREIIKEFKRIYPRHQYEAHN